MNYEIKSVEWDSAFDKVIRSLSELERKLEYSLNYTNWEIKLNVGIKKGLS